MSLMMGVELMTRGRPWQPKSDWYPKKPGFVDASAILIDTYFGDLDCLVGVRLSDHLL